MLLATDFKSYYTVNICGINFHPVNKWRQLGRAFDESINARTAHNACFLCSGKMKRCFLSLPTAPARGDNPGRETNFPLHVHLEPRSFIPEHPEGRTTAPGLHVLPFCTCQHSIPEMLRIFILTLGRVVILPPQRIKHPVACLLFSAYVGDQLGNRAQCSD